MQDRKTVSICSLKQFPPPSDEGFVTVYEKGGNLFHEPLSEAINYGKVSLSIWCVCNKQNLLGCFTELTFSPSKYNARALKAIDVEGER